MELADEAGVDLHVGVDVVEPLEALHLLLELLLDELRTTCILEKK